MPLSWDVWRCQQGVVAIADHKYGRRIGDEWQPAAQRVLIGLDDPAAAGDLARRFDEAGLLPTLAFSCEHLVREARQDFYGLIVLDERFTCGHNSECLQKVRHGSAAPILAVGSVCDDRDTNLDFAMDAERDVYAVVRRGTMLVDMSRPVRLPRAIRWGSLELDVARHEARWQGREVRLTRLQFRIMEVLAMAAGSVVSVEQLATRVWGESSVGERDRLVAHVRRIRRIIEQDPSAPRFLLKVRGRGFRLAEQESHEASE